MNAAAYFAARPGPWLMTPSALAAMRAALDACGPLRAGPEPGPPPEPRDFFDRPWPGYRIEGDIATIALHGPIVNRATPLDNLVATVLGGTILDHVRAALDDARSNRAVRGVLLDIDSPGGEAAGTPETARLVRDLDARKPVVAHVAGYGASAAYWLASAAGTVVGAPSSYTGSIGVIGGLVDDTEALAKAGIKLHRFVSTQSPRKVPDPSTPEGQDQMQEHVDGLADLFLRDVAGYRNTTPLRVMEDFGQGDVLIASEAYAVGLIDAVGSRADAIKALRRRIDAPPAARKPARRREAASLSAIFPDLDESPTPAGAQTADSLLEDLFA